MKKKTFRTIILSLLLLALTVFAGLAAYADDTDVTEEAEETPVEQIDVYSSITSSEDSLEAILVYQADLVQVLPETATMSETIRINSDFSFISDRLPAVYVDGKQLSFTQSDTGVYSTDSGSCTMQLIDPRTESETPGYVIVNINKTLKSGQNLLVVVPVVLTDVPTEAGTYSYDVGGAAASSLVTYSQSGGTLAGYNFDPLTYNLTIQEAAPAETQTQSDAGTTDETPAAENTSDTGAASVTADGTDVAEPATEDVTVETDTTEQASGSTTSTQSSQSAVMQNLTANGSSNNLYAVTLSALVMAVAVALIFVLRHRMTENEKKNRRAH